jgi:hypothetical protein
MFDENAKAAAYKRGMPAQRMTFIPHPVAFKPVPLLAEYAKGKDPVTGKVLVQEIVEALTRPLSAEEQKTGSLERSQPKLVGPDTEENLQRLFMKNGWTDGLPIVLPTPKRVAEMLKGTSHTPDEVVGQMTPGSAHEAWEYTVEKVAINAVMAGAKPEYFPVILAIASTKVPSLFASTTSFARMVVVNGPIRDEIGMNSGIGAMGPFNQANATIGRAWTLLSKNLSGAGIIGDTYLGSQGNNLSYNNVCIAENEAKSPWVPFHVQKGFKAQDSVVSVFHGWGIAHGVGVRANKGYQNQIRELLKVFNVYSSPTSYAGATVLMDPLIARDLKETEGFDTKEKLSQWLYENTLVSYSGFWDDELVISFTVALAKRGVEPFASRLEMPKDAMMPRYPDAKGINLIVLGGEANAFFQAGDFRYMSSASVDAWR